MSNRASTHHFPYPCSPIQACCSQIATIRTNGYCIYTVFVFHLSNTMSTYYFPNTGGMIQACCCQVCTIGAKSYCEYPVLLGQACEFSTSGALPHFSCTLPTSWAEVRNFRAKGHPIDLT